MNLNETKYIAPFYFLRTFINVCPEKAIEILPPPTLLAHTLQGEYNRLCRLDILRVADCPEHEKDDVYRETEKQLQRSKEGWYKASLPLCGNHPHQPTNYTQQLANTSRIGTALTEVQPNRHVHNSDQGAEGI